MDEAERKRREAEFRREYGLDDDEPLPALWDSLPTEPPELTPEMIEYGRKVAERLRQQKGEGPAVLPFDDSDDEFDDENGGQG